MCASVANTVEDRRRTAASTVQLCTHAQGKGGVPPLPAPRSPASRATTAAASQPPRVVGVALRAAQHFRVDQHCAAQCCTGSERAFLSPPAGLLLFSGFSLRMRSHEPPLFFAGGVAAHPCSRQTIRPKPPPFFTGHGGRYCAERGTSRAPRSARARCALHSTGFTQRSDCVTLGGMPKRVRPTSGLKSTAGLVSTHLRSDSLLH